LSSRHGPKVGPRTGHCHGRNNQPHYLRTEHEVCPSNFSSRGPVRPISATASSARSTRGSLRLRSGRVQPRTHGRPAVACAQDPPGALYRGPVPQGGASPVRKAVACRKLPRCKRDANHGGGS
jgi:hypothetical protein